MTDSTVQGDESPTRTDMARQVGKWHNDLTVTFQARNKIQKQEEELKEGQSMLLTEYRHKRQQLTVETEEEQMEEETELLRKLRLELSAIERKRRQMEEQERRLKQKIERHRSSKK